LLAAPSEQLGRSTHSKEALVIVLGVVLLLIGFLAKISILWTIGIVLVVVGALLAVLGGTGRKVGGRAHWY
jgi:uncharacterized membrane protein HdeD (DUF308 family)